MKIRSIKESDIDTIGTIYERAFEYSEGIIKYYQGFPEYVKFSMKQGYAFVLEEGTVCGVILGYEKPDMFMGKVAYIELLAVLPECQGKGYGKALIQKFEEVVIQKEIKQLSLRTGCYMKAFHIYHQSPTPTSSGGLKRRPQGLCYCSPERRVSQALLLAAAKKRLPHCLLVVILLPVP